MNIVNEFKLPDWEKYSPKEIDYYSNRDRQDLLCRFKLKQVYQNLCIARINCIFPDEKNNYGDLDPEGKNKKWIKNLFLQNALLYYNICIDLSWCMVYFYYVPKKEGKFNIDNEEIEEIENVITYDSLQSYLTSHLIMLDDNDEEKVILEEIIKLTSEFWCNKIPEGFRKDYNYIKHKGTFDIFDTGKNKVEALFLINGNNPNITIHKFKEFDSEKYIYVLRNFHNIFLEYMDSIINIIIKPKYSSSKYDFNEIMNNALNNSSNQ